MALKYERQWQKVLSNGKLVLTGLYEKVAIYFDEEITGEDALAKEALNKAVVTISTGKKFYVDPVSRADIADAIALLTEQSLTSTTWKLAEAIKGNKVQTVTLAELQEARYLGLQYKGNLIGVQ